MSVGLHRIEQNFRFVRSPYVVDGADLLLLANMMEIASGRPSQALPAVLVHVHVGHPKTTLLQMGAVQAPRGVRSAGDDACSLDW